MTLRSQSRARRAAGYSLIEVMVATVILTIGVAAAAKLSLVMVTQEEINQRVSVCLAHHEMAARLYQLGLEPAEIAVLLPDEPQVASFTFATPGVTSSGAVDVQFVDSTMVINTTPAGAHTAGGYNGGGDAAAAETRTHTLRAHRYANRYR